MLQLFPFLSTSYLRRLLGESLPVAVMSKMPIIEFNKEILSDYKVMYVWEINKACVMLLNMTLLKILSSRSKSPTFQYSWTSRHVHHSSYRSQIITTTQVRTFRISSIDTDIKATMHMSAVGATHHTSHIWHSSSYHIFIKKHRKQKESEHKDSPSFLHSELSTDS